MFIVATDSDKGSRFTFVTTSSVPKALLGQEVDTGEVAKKKKPTKTSRKKSSSSRSLNKPDDPSVAKKRVFKDQSRLLPNEDGELTKVHPLSRATSSWSAGLYSCVLSAAIKRSPEDH